MRIKYIPMNSMFYSYNFIRLLNLAIYFVLFTICLCHFAYSQEKSDYRGYHNRFGEVKRDLDNDQEYIPPKKKTLSHNDDPEQHRFVPDDNDAEYVKPKSIKTQDEMEFYPINLQ
jgi:hypothetical protein